MRVLIFDESFRRALKRRCKNRPQLQAKVLNTLSLLEIDPFSPTLKTHKANSKISGLALWNMTFGLSSIFRNLRMRKKRRLS
jgi:mRNA-degrading endonuclease YafQ of YafQ-DinJ toxin-antitoxin module